MKKYNPIKNLKHWAHAPKSKSTGVVSNSVKVVKSVVRSIKKSNNVRTD